MMDMGVLRWIWVCYDGYGRVTMDMGVRPHAMYLGELPPRYFGVLHMPSDVYGRVAYTMYVGVWFHTIYLGVLPSSHV